MQLFQLKLSLGKAEKSNTNAIGFLGIANKLMTKFLVCLQGDYQSKYKFVETPRNIKMQ